MSNQEMGLAPVGGMLGQVAVQRSGGHLQAEADAAKAAALVQARYVMAVQRPRNFEDVRRRMLDACKRSSFANASRFKIKNKGEGWTIRFAEEAFRAMGNLSIDTLVTYEDEHIRKVRIEVCDLETNAPWGDEVVIQKTVERKNRKDREVLSERENSYGETVYCCKATEDEVLLKQQGQVSRRARSLILRMIDGGVLEECQREVLKTVRQQIERDPKGELRKILDGFALLNVMPSDLQELVGKPPERLSPMELAELRKTWTAIQEGASFDDMLREAKAERGEGDAADGTQSQEDSVLADLGEGVGPGDTGHPVMGVDVGRGESQTAEQPKAKRKPKGWKAASEVALPPQLTGGVLTRIGEEGRSPEGLLMLASMTDDAITKALPGSPMLAMNLRKSIDLYLSAEDVQQALAAAQAADPTPSATE